MTRPSDAPTSTDIIGVDPGGRTTGLVVRRGRALLHAELIRNDGPTCGDDYLLDVLDAIGAAWEPGIVVAVEDVVHPNPHLGIANLDGLLATAQVLGVVRGVCLQAGIPTVVIAPGGHGSAPLSTYPAALVGPNEPKGTGRFRHLRSAWDVAGAARMLRQGAA